MVATLAPAGATAAAATAAAGSAGGATILTPTSLALPSPARRRWQLLPYALAFVLGFGSVFTLLGLTVYVGGSILGLTLPPAWLTVLRQLGGVVLIVLGLNLAGLLRLDRLQRILAAVRCAPHRAGPARRADSARTPAAVRSDWGRSSRSAGRPASDPPWARSCGLSAIGPSAQVVALFAAYSLGLAVPFLVVALALERATALLPPSATAARSSWSVACSWPASAWPSSSTGWACWRAPSAS